MELLNDNQVTARHQATFLQFGGLQDRLTRSLVLMLTSGLLLAIGTALYVLRLEREARDRYAELAAHRSELQAAFCPAGGCAREGTPFDFP